MSAPTVFISYSHDSPEHSERVLQFSNALRSHGVDVELDRYHVRPPKGWPHWCEEQLRPENSKFVLMVCTQTYLKRVQDKVAADEGRGVFWEGGIIYDYIYDEKGNTRFVPILFSDGVADFIPVPIRNHTRYRIEAFDFTDVGYQALYRELTGQPLVTKPPLGEVIKLGEQLAATVKPLAPRDVRTDFAPAPADFQADISRILKYAPAELIGRDEELKLLNDAWDRVVQGEKKRSHVLTFVALGGEGKTSLVTKWVVDEMLAKGWPGCDAAFAWSFYSQGTREQHAASSDLFLKEALNFFGDPAMASSAQSAFDKGRRLAQLIGKRRALLILDGLEPLQYAPTSPTAGELKDAGLIALLKGLAAANYGLCIVTTRYSIPNVKPFWQTTAPEVKLLRLSREAGVHLLQSFAVTGSLRRTIQLDKELVNEFEKLVEDVKGHALTLNLLGTYLRDAHGGDIRKRDRVNFKDADSAHEHKHHAFRVMGAYVQWLAPTGFRAWLNRLFSKEEREIQAAGRRALAMLHLLGLFDRPITEDCLAALLKSPTISGLTYRIVELSDSQRNITLNRLETAKLLTVNRDRAGALVSLDAHPLLREYFGRQLRTHQPDAWREGHRRLYEHLCDTTKEGDKPTIEDLQPLYQAVAHGCQAGLEQQAAQEIYYQRILRGNELYSAKKLGAFGSDLGVVACFFEVLWSQVSPALSDYYQGWMLNNAAYFLRGLGRLTEALDPFRATLEIQVAKRDWESAAVCGGNLSELELTLGKVAGAVRDGEQSVSYADRSGNEFRRMITLTIHADALHHAGCHTQAVACFREAEQLQAERQPNYPLLYSLQGFRYCDLLLAAPERAAWQTSLNLKFEIENPRLVDSCSAISHRTAQTLEWATTGQTSLLSIALDHLTLGRAAVYQAILESSISNFSSSKLEAVVAEFRRAGQQEFIVRGLLTRAWLRFLTGARTGIESAQEDLDEAWEIAERGPMRLHMADIYLYRARLFGRMKDEGGRMNYPWNKNPDGSARGPKDDLAAARKLIEQCGYWRRKEELEDAEAAAENW